jgi:hypothetical protein
MQENMTIIEEVIYNELDLESIKTSNQNATITYRKLRWSDTKGKNFFLRLWHSMPRWVLVAASTLITYLLSNWEDLLEMAKAILRK